MALVKMSAKQAWAEGESDVDRDKLARTSEAEVHRYMIEDGENPDAEPAFARFTPPSEIRARLNMTQAAFADALAVPVKTLRNWEQRERLDPAVKTLLRIVSADPERAFKAVHGERWGHGPAGRHVSSERKRGGVEARRSTTQEDAVKK